MINAQQGVDINKCQLLPGDTVNTGSAPVHGANLGHAKGSHTKTNTQSLEDIVGLPPHQLSRALCNYLKDSEHKNTEQRALKAALETTVKGGHFRGSYQLANAIRAAYPGALNGLCGDVQHHASGRCVDLEHVPVQLIKPHIFRTSIDEKAAPTEEAFGQLFAFFLSMPKSDSYAETIAERMAAELDKKPNNEQGDMQPKGQLGWSAADTRLLDSSRANFAMPLKRAWYRKKLAPAIERGLPKDSSCESILDEIFRSPTPKEFTEKFICKASPEVLWMWFDFFTGLTTTDPYAQRVVCWIVDKLDTDDTRAKFANAVFTPNRRFGSLAYYMYKQGMDETPVTDNAKAFLVCMLDRASALATNKDDPRPTCLAALLEPLERHSHDGGSWYARVVQEYATNCTSNFPFHTTIPSHDSNMPRSVTCGALLNTSLGNGEL